MKRITLILGVVAVMAAMLVALAAPAMADDKKNNDNDRNNHHNRFFNDDIKLVFDDDFFDDDFRHRGFDFDDAFDFEQDAESGDVDQSLVVTNTGDNSNQCAGFQGVANTGNAQNAIGVSDFGNFNDVDGDRFDGDDDDFEFDEVGSTIEVSPENMTSCDQEVNQAATASGW